MAYQNAHAARLNENNVVVQVIVIPYCNDNDDEITAYCNSNGIAGRWIDTSYTGSRRGTYAGIGYTYDPATDTFTPPPTPEPDPVE